MKLHVLYADIDLVENAMRWTNIVRDPVRRHVVVELTPEQVVALKPRLLSGGPTQETVERVWLEREG